MTNEEQQSLLNAIACAAFGWHELRPYNASELPGMVARLRHYASKHVMAEGSLAAAPPANGASER